MLVDGLWLGSQGMQAVPDGILVLENGEWIALEEATRCDNYYVWKCRKCEQYNPEGTFRACFAALLEEVNEKRIILFLFLGMCCSLFGSTIEEKLKHIPLHDKICMKRFFDFAIRFDQAAYVLCFDNKSVCFTGVVIKDKHKTFNDVLCLKGWYAFKKHENLFPHPNFIFNERRREANDLKVVDIFRRSRIVF